MIGQRAAGLSGLESFGLLWGRAGGPHLGKFWAAVGQGRRPAPGGILGCCRGQGRRPAPGEILGCCGAGPEARTCHLASLAAFPEPHVLPRFPGLALGSTSAAHMSVPSWPTRRCPPRAPQLRQHACYYQLVYVYMLCMCLRCHSSSLFIHQWHAARVAPRRRRRGIWCEPNSCKCSNV